MARRHRVRQVHGCPTCSPAAGPLCTSVAGVVGRVLGGRRREGVPASAFVGVAFTPDEVHACLFLAGALLSTACWRVPLPRGPPHALPRSLLVVPFIPPCCSEPRLPSWIPCARRGCWTPRFTTQQTRQVQAAACTRGSTLVPPGWGRWLLPSATELPSAWLAPAMAQSMAAPSKSCPAPSHVLQVDFVLRGYWPEGVLPRNEMQKRMEVRRGGGTCPAHSKPSRGTAAKPGLPWLCASGCSLPLGLQRHIRVMKRGKWHHKWQRHRVSGWLGAQRTTSLLLMPRIFLFFFAGGERRSGRVHRSCHRPAACTRD